MLARRRLLPNLRASLKSPYICEPRAIRLGVEWHVSPMRALQSRALLVSQQQQKQQQYRALPTASVVRGRLERTYAVVGATTEGSSRARFASTRAVKVAHGSRAETPAIPSFIEIRLVLALLGAMFV